jgi:superfamily II DNA or RNA helicase
VQLDVRLVFDRGTLLLRGSDRTLELADVPGLLWDPRVRAYRAPAWRHAEVASALAARGVRFSDDVRCRRDPAGRWQDIALREYQARALDAWDRGRRRGVVVLPTGSGKTRVALAAMAKTAGAALCLVPTRVLLDQWCGEIATVYGGRPVGRFGDGARQVAAITVSTYESALRYMDVLGNRFDLLVLDEVHHFGAGAHDEALEMCTARSRLGLTATPISEAAVAENVTRLIGPIVYELGIGDLAGTFLADFDIITVRVDLTDEERARYERLSATFRATHAIYRRLDPAGTWREFVAAAGRTAEGRAALQAWRESRRLVSMSSAKRRAVAELLTRHRNARVLVFVADNQAAYTISSENLVMPLTCDIGRKERADALERFRRGELRALVSARVLNEGLDVPDADVAIVVGGAQGEREHVQRVGRLLRPAPGKRAIVYELVARRTAEVRQAAKRRRGLAARRVAGLPTAG